MAFRSEEGWRSKAREDAATLEVPSRFANEEIRVITCGFCMTRWALSLPSPALVLGAAVITDGCAGFAASRACILFPWRENKALPGSRSQRFATFLFSSLVLKP